MGEYLSPLAAAHGNLAVNATDGSVWANYLLRGAQMVPSSPGSVTSAQTQNIALFHALSTMPTTDVFLGGFRTRVNPEETAQRIIAGLTAVSRDSHPRLRERVAKVYQEMTFGRFKEFRRVYFLSIRIPTSQTAAARALVKAGKLDVLSNLQLDWEEWDRYQRQFVEKIPRAFYRSEEDLLTRPEHLVWMHERMRRRGIAADVPMLPSGGSDMFNPHGFSDIMINKADDSDVILDEFMANTAKGYTPNAVKGRFRQFLRNYRSAVLGGQLAVYSPAERSASLPDGPVSRQSLLAVTGYPREPKVVLNTFTSLVDRDPHLDADFALRMHFDQGDISVEQQRAFQQGVSAESGMVSADRHEEDQYAQQWAEREKLGHQARGETRARAIAVSTIFALADPNAEKLRQARADFTEKLAANGFSVLAPVGGQFDLLQQMLPCVPTSALVNDLKGGSTVEKFGACMPIRRTDAGDAIGVPYAVNRENALGQIILKDFIGSTDRGSGSFAVTGAQGSGKSLNLKTAIDWLTAMRRPMTIWDQSASREYLSFARSLGASCQAIEVLRPKVSFDPLKVFAHDPPMAQEATVELFQILSGYTVDSPQMLLLSDLVQPGFRQSKDIFTLRDLLRVLDTDGSVRNRAGAAELARQMSFWAGQSAYNQALFDPITQSGDVQTVLPPYRRSSDEESIVFVTYGMPVHQGPILADTPPKSRFSVALFTLMGRLTQADFNRIDGLAAMVGDEVAFWEGSDVLEKIISEHDKTGRKENNIGIFAGQLPSHMSSGAFALIRTLVALRQETVDNAKAALAWVGMPPTDKMVTKMVADTAPPDPEDNNRPTRGREGEGWYNDGFGNVVRCQLIPMFSDEGMRLADTTASRMIKERHLEAQEAAEAAARAQQQQQYQPQSPTWR